jgi:hypothetical protein
MVIIVTPKKGALRCIEVIPVSSPGDAYEQFTKVNDAFDSAGERDSVDITLAMIPTSHVGTWIQNHVDPNWYERITGRVRYAIWSQEYPG